MAQLKAGVGAADTLFQHEKPNKPNRSALDLSRITNFTCDAGMIVPFDWFFCLPGDDVYIDFEMILDTLPLVNPSLTSYKAVTHWYKIDCKHLWQGWQTFITKGRSGNVNWNIPKLDVNFAKYSSVGDTFNFGNSHDVRYVDRAISQHSLSAFLGVPSTSSGIWKFNSSDECYLESNYLPYTRRPLKQNEGGSISDALANKYISACDTGLYSVNEVNALPYMAYQNIVKYNYVNSNLLQDNHSLFPVEGDHDWFLKSNALLTNFVDFSSNVELSDDDVYNINGVYSSSDTVTRLDLLRYAMFDDDYFTTGLPWITRGTAPNSDLEVTVPEDFFKLASENMNLTAAKIGPGSNISSFGVNSDGTGSAFALEGIDQSPYSNTVRSKEATNVNLEALYSLINKIKVVKNQSALNPTANLTANLLREMLAMSVWQERNAHVDGSYNAMIYEHWMSNPNAEEHKPEYIGGTADYVNFATILQSSQSTSDSPLGTTAGRGSAGGNGSVGHVHCDDYCYIMGVMIIKPNTTYMQGIEHHLVCENVFEDFPQPEFEGLSPQPILNKELYVGNDNFNDDLFAYQERYVYLKARQNVNRGLFQCKPDKDRLFGSFTQARWFSSRPSLSYQFLCMSPDNIRRDWLAYPSQPMFKLQTASKVKVVRNLAYTSRPNTFGF